jgi:rhamnose utilization protein RhaD (predicted bifunctional aldolase and dehydrogenase)/NAD(P)-dependent dehydrogenase (short-subunit alcohol dehydrogenase family)
MQSLWSDAEAQEYVKRYAGAVPADVALRVYSSRLIGREPSLVLHGGGNTSVKTRMADDLGQDIDVLCVKGSGWDLIDLEPAGLPALRLAPLLALRALPSMSDEAMVNAQRIRMLDAGAPNPSVETLLHAFLPHKFIDHSHADAILALVDQPQGEQIVRDLFGDRFGVVPYIMPGFALAKLAAEVYEQNPRVEGLVLLKHGFFTFGDSARQSYERHVEAVTAAESFAHARRRRPSHPPPALNSDAFAQLAPVLRGLLGEGRRRYQLQLRQSPEISAFLLDPKLDALSQLGCVTPDHVIRTKRFPLVLRLDHARRYAEQRGALGSALERYRADYRAYVARQTERKATHITPLDPDPRILLVPGIGLVAAADSDKGARIAADIYEHTISVIRDAEAVGHYEALPENDIFDMEYWSLEQAKLGKSAPKPLAGRVVYVSGAAYGIGAAIARRFAAAGAALFLVDRDGARLQPLAASLGAAHEVVELSDEAAVRASVDHCVCRFGGLDGLVSNAGVAPQGAIAGVSTAELERSFQINFYAHHWLASAAVSVMRAQAMGGFLLFNASKAAWNPGAEFGPYAIPKAALLALMKQYALECGQFQIRSNAVNADRIRTHLLDADDIAARAAARGLDADAYYRSNLLAREVSAEDVAEAFLQLALAPSTTGSVITVDGGNIAASPR